MTDEPAASREPGPADPPDSRGWWQTFRSLPGPVRWTSYGAAGLVLLLVVAVVTTVVFVRRPFPQTTGTIEIPGLEGTVEVLRDDHGIPQVYADSTHDLMMAQGYVHAQERFFEMDLRRHVTSGRLSELFGESTLETDKVIRTLGWRRIAEQEVALVSPETRSALQSYADGVNAYLDTHSPTRIALQYTVLRASGLDYAPADWTPADSLAWLKAMAWDLEGSSWIERLRVLLGVNHTPAEVAQILGGYPYDEHRPIVAGGVVVDGRFRAEGAARAESVGRPAFRPGERRALTEVERAVGRVPALLGRGDGIGSNSWVVDGEHSATGAPILANDPHLGVSMPGIWVQMGLHCRTVSEDCPLDVAGFTFSGFPGVIIGHNADIAWGFTNLGPDVSDYYLERIVGDQWRYDRKLRPLTVRHETIEVRGGDDFDLTIRATDHGPLLSDVSKDLSTVGANAEIEGSMERGNGFAVALSWTGLRATTTADAVLALDSASDWDEFRAAARLFAVPAQNMVYADRAGHIGYQTPGLIPIRRPGNDGTLPAEGWRSENDWTGRFVPFRALPSVLDPDEGLVVTANQAPIGGGYPFYLGDSWDMGYRSERIRTLLEGELDRLGRLSVDDLAAIQNDDLNPMAAVLVPHLLDIEGLGSAYYRQGQDLLRDWDFHQPADSAAAAYYNAVWSNLLRLTFHDEMRESIWPDGGDVWFAAVDRLLDRPTDGWWDDRETEDVRETRDDILRQAMVDARDEMTSRQALDPDEWTWGRSHELDLEEQTLGSSGIGILEWLFDRRGFEVGGGTSVVNATSWDAGSGYGVTAAPSMRMVVSMADLDDSRWINLTGVSGHPFSAHYADQTDLWVAGRTLPWAFSADAVEAATQDTLTLVPAPGGA
ncbi:MAG: penicillin acylase family protein [Nocardioidaceae bacterium]